MKEIVKHEDADSIGSMSACARCGTFLSTWQGKGSLKIINHYFTTKEFHHDHIIREEKTERS